MRISRPPLLCLVLFLAAMPAVAAQRTFVSATSGNDANISSNCSPAAPCRGFAAALTVTSSGGEIIVLDSGGYGAASIAQSVSIVGAPGVHAAVSVFSGAGFAISGGGIAVTLRNLYINGLGGAYGVQMTGGSKLAMENCVVANFSSGGAGVAISTAANVQITGTMFRDNLVGLSLGAGSTTAINDSQFYGNTTTGIAAANATGGTTIAVAANNLTASYNGTAIQAAATASSATTLLTLTNSTITRNTIGLQQQTSGGGTATLESLGNNTVRQNTTNTSGTITTVALQ